MDELRRQAVRVFDRWQQLARGQRIGVLIVLAAGAAAFSWLLAHVQPEWQPVGNGREFTTTEIAAIQSAWRDRGLKEFRREGRKLCVPSAELQRYETALPKTSAAGSAADSEWEKQFAGVNVFTSHEEFEQRKDNALRHEVRRVLKAIPAIADVDVIWARSKSRSAFPNRSRVTATINVVPREGFDLSPELAQSLRTAVAGMIPDLVVDDIAVLDQSTGLAITGQSDERITEQQRRQQQVRQARQLEARIAAALAQVPNASVQATLADAVPPNRHTTAKPSFGSELVFASEAPDKLVEFSPTLSADEVRSDFPETDSNPIRMWQVSIQIPESYLDAHAAQQLLIAPQHATNLDDLRNAECARLRQRVQSLLPSNAQIANFTVVPGIAVTDDVQASLPFTAWPHLLCGCLAVVSVTLATLRSRTATSSSGDASTPHSLPSEDVRFTLVAPVKPESQDGLAAHDEAAVAASPIPSEPISEISRLQQIDPQRLAELLRQERPQAIAVLLTRFPTRHASACLSRLTPALQTEVIRRLKTLGDVSDELVMEIARTVCLRMSPTDESGPYEPTNRIAHLIPDVSKPKVCA